jgi:hypothetical protein
MNSESGSSSAMNGQKDKKPEMVVIPSIGSATWRGIDIPEAVIQKGADAGKTEAELVAEVFDPNVSDLEYFLSRRKALGIKNEHKTKATV